MQLSYHALEQITNRSISESEVANAIKFGARWGCRKDPEIKYSRLDDTMVVTHGDDWVLTAYRIGGKRGTTFDPGEGRQSIY